MPYLLFCLRQLFPVVPSFSFFSFSFSPRLDMHTPVMGIPQAPKLGSQDSREMGYDPPGSAACLRFASACTAASQGHAAWKLWTGIGIKDLHPSPSSTRTHRDQHMTGFAHLLTPSASEKFVQDMLISSSLGCVQSSRVSVNRITYIPPSPSLPPPNPVSWHHRRPAPAHTITAPSSNFHSYTEDKADGQTSSVFWPAVNRPLSARQHKYSQREWHLPSSMS